MGTWLSNQIRGAHNDAEDGFLFRFMSPYKLVSGINFLERGQCLQIEGRLYVFVKLMSFKSIVTC